jgi:hypothetical protein
MEVDPSQATKEDQTRRLENIILESGRAAKLLLDGSHQHEVKLPPAPQMDRCRTEKDDTPPRRSS